MNKDHSIFFSFKLCIVIKENHGSHYRVRALNVNREELLLNFMYTGGAYILEHAHQIGGQNIDSSNETQ